MSDSAQFLVKVRVLVESALRATIIIGSGLILFIPLVTVRDSLFFYIFGKIVYFQVIVEVLFVAWIFLCLLSKKYRPPVRHPLVFSLFSYLAILVITAAVGVDPNRSFWSSQERATGVIAMIHFSGWFLILISTLKEWKPWRRLLIAGLFANTLVGLYGIGQRLGVRVLLPDLSAERLASTLGNPIYLGVYALMCAYIAGFCLSREKNNLWRLFFFCSIFFNFYLLIESASRGVTLALLITIFSLGTTISLLVPHSIWKKRIRVGLASLVCMIIVSLTYLYSPPGRVWADDNLPKFFADKIVYNPFYDPGRQTLWSMSVKGFLDRPLTGWGWENFNYINDKEIGSKKGITNPWNDRSHNQILDVLALTGVFGLISYLVLWGTLAVLIVKKIKQSGSLGRRVPLLIILFAFGAYFLQNLTVFDTPAPLIVFYFLLALAYFLIRERPKFEILSGSAGLERKRAREEKLQSERKPFPLWGFVILPLLIAVAAGGVWYVSLFHLNASKEGIRLLYMIQPGSIEKTIDGFTHLFAQGSFTAIEFREQLADALNSAVNNPYISPSEREQLIRYVISETEKNVASRPRDLRYGMRLMYLYAFSPNQDATKNAIATAEKLIELYPNRYELYRNMAELAFQKGENEKGLSFAKKASEANQNASRSIWYLAVAYAKIGDNEAALKTAWRAMAADDGIASYGDLINALAQSLKAPISQEMLEYFATLAAAYGREDQRFMYAGNKVFETAQADAAAAILAKTKK